MSGGNVPELPEKKHDQSLNSSTGIYLSKHMSVPPTPSLGTKMESKPQTFFITPNAEVKEQVFKYYEINLGGSNSHNQGLG